MSALRGVPPAVEEPSRRVNWFLWVFSVVMIVVAGSAFLMKLIEFSSTATRHGSDALGSFLIPVLNYLLVAAGFFCLFFWAYAKGHYRDIEAPKYRMLELEREYDRAAQKEGS